METLPPEMLEIITQYLTLRDLARCCKVCRDWRNIFNEDCHWRRHQDLLLEEHLRTTPCSVEPAFVPPGAENSTLTPISNGRLFLLKEKHLWNNWIQEKCMKEEILELKDEVHRSFLTNNLLVRWCLRSIEIWDVSVIPMTPLVKTDPSVDIRGCIYCTVVSNNTLLVQQIGFVKVFNVDVLERTIELKHNIRLDAREELYPIRNFNPVLTKPLNVVKGNIYIHIINFSRSFEIIDLESGERIEEELCPVLREEEDYMTIIAGIKSSSSSDNVLFLCEYKTMDFFVYEYNDFGNNGRHLCYIYSPSQRTFLPGPVAECYAGNLDYFAIHGDYLAVGELGSITIYNYITLEAIYTGKYYTDVWPLVFNNCFVFPVRPIIYEKAGDDGRYDWLGIYSPIDRTMSTISYHYHICEGSLSIINDKFVKIIYKGRVLGIWEPSCKTLKLSKIPDITSSSMINHAFTRGADDKSFEEQWPPLNHNKPSFVYHYW